MHAARASPPAARDQHGFTGFEQSAVFSEEAKDRRRTVPTATYLSSSAGAIDPVPWLARRTPSAFEARFVVEIGVASVVT
jgi:hypothetical protein